MPSGRFIYIYIYILHFLWIETPNKTFMLVWLIGQGAPIPPIHQWVDNLNKFLGPIFSAPKDATLVEFLIPPF